MISYLAQKYQHALWLTEEPLRCPTEIEVQTLWFESLFHSKLTTDTGSTFTVIQPGIWNRAAGPDFLHSSLRDSQGSTLTGPIEIHLRAPDWETHGHHLDDRYEGTILHGVWFRPAQPFFPSTKQFRRVPQTILSEQLVAPWAELCEVVDPISYENRPLAQPGICQRELAKASPDQIVTILRSAGAWRLRRKAEKLRWRERTRGRKQGLWESLAEALGYSQNKVAMRLLAQRAPVSWTQLKKPTGRSSLLFGLAGFLPAESLSSYSHQTRSWLRPLWDYWWKERDRLTHAILPRQVWQLSGLRPNNRPERRIAALSSLYPYLDQLERSLRQADHRTFTNILLALEDPFWSHTTTWQAKPSPLPLHLVGRERIKDILLNIFWPWVSLIKGDLAYEAIRQSTSPPNQLTRIAKERVLGQISIGKALREALIQQGLLQLYQDFCLADNTACHRCPFPDLVRKF